MKVQLDATKKIKKAYSTLIPKDSYTERLILALNYNLNAVVQWNLSIQVDNVVKKLVFTSEKVSVES